MDHLQEYDGSGEESFNSSSRPHTPINNRSQRIKARNGLMHKLFSRRGSKTDEDDEDYDDDAESEIGPNPSVRPLGQKLVARSENFAVPSSLTSRQESRQITSLSRAIRYGESVAASREATRRSAESTSSGIVERASFSDGELTEEESSQHINSICDAIAADAALNRHYIRDWSAYLKSYSEGKFNLHSPPTPPPRDSSFTFLPAIYPVNEAARLETVKRCETNWSKTTSRRAKAITNDARRVFGCERVSISVFDRDHEWLLASNGYSSQKLTRWESIAGHVLLMSGNILVVLDAKKDWRFAGNRFVTGNPNIRFHAAAPMIAPNGAIIGAVSIFDSNVWKQFTALQSRRLCDFAAQAVSELMNYKDIITDDERETPILQRQDLIDGTATFGTIEAQKPNSKKTRVKRCTNDADLIPKALSVRKASSNYTDHPQNATSTTKSAVSSDVPHDSFPSNVVESAYGAHGNDGEDYSYASEYAAISEEIARQTYGEDSSQDRQDEGISRPDSPVLPLEDIMAKAIPVEPLLAYDSMTDTFSDIEDALVTAQTNIDQAHMSFVDDTQNSPRESIAGSLSTDVSSEDRYDSDARAEALFAAEFWACRLKFDVIYAVRLDPMEDFLSEEQLQQPENFRLTTLVSYGINDDTNYDINIHLHTLRSDGALVWHKKDGIPGEYSRGFLMRMAREPGPIQTCTHGIIFAAFRKVSASGNETAKLDSKDIVKLQSAAQILKRILTKPVSDSLPKRSNTMPSRASIPFPANEAQEIGKFSLDAGVRRLVEVNNHLIEFRGD